MKFRWLPKDDTSVKGYLPFLFLGLAVTLLYGHTLQVPFYLDDSGAIYDSKVVKDLALAFSRVLTMRGLSTLTFALNYRVGELNVVGYHLANISIHFAASCLVLLLLRRVFPQRPWQQYFGALLFVAHPLQTQAVTYLVQRMTSLSALLFLLAIYLFVRARESIAAGVGYREQRHLFFYFGALVAGALAILGKENAVILPVALWLYSRFFLSDQAEGWRSQLVYLLPFFAIPLLAVVAYLLVPLLSGPGLDTMGYSRHLRSMEGNTPLHYLATQCSVLWIYIRMLFLPFGQALDHAYPISPSLITAKSVGGFLGLAGLVALAWHLHRRQPAITFAIGWFFLTLAVESSFIPLDPLFEHRLYLPMFALSVLVPTLVELLPRSVWQYLSGVVVILSLMILTWQRNDLWRNPIAFNTDNLKVSPDNERVYFNLGQEYLKVGLVAEGEGLVRESIALNPSRHFGYMSLYELYVAQDRLDEAIGMLEYGLDHVQGKDQGPLYNNLSYIYAKKGEFASAIEVLQLAIAADPGVPATYYNLAQMLMFAGEPQRIEENLRKTLALDPNHGDARAMLESLMAERRVLPNPGTGSRLGH